LNIEDPDIQVDYDQVRQQLNRLAEFRSDTVVRA